MIILFSRFVVVVVIVVVVIVVVVVVIVVLTTQLQNIALIETFMLNESLYK